MGGGEEGEAGNGGGGLEGEARDSGGMKDKEEGAGDGGGRP